MTRTSIPTCADPECRYKGGHGLTGAFCKRHAKRLAKIRDEFQAEQRARCSSFEDGKWRVKSGTKAQPVCCTVGCYEPRRLGEAFCAVCRAMEMAA